MRQTQRVADFMGDAADENRVVSPERNAPVLAVLDVPGVVRQPVEIQNRRVHLPCSAALDRAACVIRTVLADDAFLGVPVRHVAKDHNGFFRRIEARLAQGGDTFAADVAAAFSVIVRIRILAAHKVNADEAIVG